MRVLYARLSILIIRNRFNSFHTVNGVMRELLRGVTQVVFHVEWSLHMTVYNRKVKGYIVAVWSLFHCISDG